MSLAGTGWDAIRGPVHELKNWMFQHRRSLALLLAWAFIMLVVKHAHLRWGHDVVDAMYSGRLGRLGSLLEILPGRRLARYHELYELFANWALGFAWWLWAATVAGLFWFRGLTGRRAIVTGLAILVLVLFNGLRIGHVSLWKGSQAWIRRAEVLADKAGSFDQNRVLRELGATNPDVFLYRLDEHLDDATSSGTVSAVESGSLSDPGAMIEFDGEDPISLEVRGGEARIENGVVQVVNNEATLLVSREELGINLKDLGVIEILARHDRGSWFEVGWAFDASATGDDFYNFQRVRRVRIESRPDGRFHRYRILAEAFGGSGRSADTIERFFLRPSDIDGDVVDIDYIRFLPARSKYPRAGFGTARETIGGETRAVIFAMTPHRLSYEVEIPDGGAKLSAGFAAPTSGSRVLFSVVVSVDGESFEILPDTLSQPDRWHDFSADLSDWEGKAIEITLRADASPGAVALWANPTIYQRVQDPRNVLLVVEDTLRVDHMSVYGYGRPTTPGKRRWLAEHGVFLKNAVSQATKTRPSAASFMTSLLPSATGVLTHHDRLGDRYVTLAEVLRSRGYKTASFIQNPNVGAMAGLDQGFDHVVSEVIVGDRAETLYSDAVIDWIESHRDRNLFVYLHAIDPHGPYDPPAQFDRWPDGDGSDSTTVWNDETLDPPWLDTPTVERRIGLYDGEILYNDHVFADFLDRLDSLGWLRNTLIVFMSDHGEHLGEHRVWEHRPPGNRQVLHVPLLVALPGYLQGGQTIDAPVQLLDVMPTVLELTGIDVTCLMLQGDSLVPLMTADGEGYGHRLVISEEVSNRDIDAAGAWGSMFFGRWHILNSRQFLLLSHLFDSGFGWDWFHEFSIATRVYDLRRDPDENRYLNPFLFDPFVKWQLHRTLTRLRRHSEEIHRHLGSIGDEEPLEVDPEVQERLRALGYH